MKVDLQYGAQIATAAGTHEESAELADGSSLYGLLKHLAERHGDAFAKFVYNEAGQVQSSLLVAINDAQVDKEGDVNLPGDCSVMLLSPMAGG